MELVRELGAVAGLAAVVGLGVLSALYLSQARDVRRLRAWAGRAPERSERRPPRRSRPRYGRIGTRHVAIALVGVLALGGAYGVTQTTGGDGGDDAGNAQANDDGRSPHEPTRDDAVVTPGNVTVAVLNGTTVPGLAAMLRDQIAAAGFEKGTIDVFSDQQLAESVVQYTPGHQAEAKAVGRTSDIGRREPAAADSRALAGDATVIVIAGADKAP